MRRWIVLVGVATIAGIFAALALVPAELPTRAPARVVLDREGEPLRFVLAPDDRWRFPVRLAEVSPVLREAIVVAEDRRFRDHLGVDPLAILRAVWTGVRAGRLVSGASTIPMQIARMSTPAERTISAKLAEALRAIRLDARFTKEEMLESYLDLAPFGANLEGVAAASFFYFAKSPAELSLGEAALLTALPRAPNAYDPISHPAAARRARDRVLGQLSRAGTFSEAEIADARRHPLPAARRPVPFLAPHFADLVLAENPGATRLATTLDRRTQRIAERQVERRAPALRASGIPDAAIVVIEIESRAVRAMVGSADWSGPRGQVNGAVARRSPGSTLKPFLYAQAIDEGRLVPESTLLDVPTDFAGYVAENYDGRYRGLVTAREALVHSLNASAVRLLAEVGLGSFHRTLRRGGLATLDRAPSAYGLPLILGSGEVTLLDLTNLYATLAEGGSHRPARRVDGPPVGPTRIFSSDAAAMVTSILTEIERPDLPSAWRLARDAPEVAWKTGTSYGHRDAWAIGFSGKYAIGVWVGSFEGRGRKGLSGAEHAGPILFDLFRALEPAGARIAASRSPGRVTVCAVSREIPGPDCPRAEIDVLPGVTRLAPCAVHRRVFVDVESGARLAGECLGRHLHRPETIAVFPAELVAWWRAIGESPPALPPLHPDCASGATVEPPRIVSPGATTPYRIRGDAPLGFQKLALEARVAPTAARLWWYQDGDLVAAASPEERVFVPLARGGHHLVVVDDSGASDSLRYRVE